MKIVRIILIIVFLAAGYFVANWAVRPDVAPIWTGFGKYDEETDGPRAKTLWDWMDLLIIPLAVGILAWSFKEAEKEKANRSEEERSQNESLDSFIKIMTELIIKHNLTNEKSSFESRTIARTRINLAFSNLNKVRKGQVLQFLFESGLIDKTPKINILGADIKGAVLDGIVLSQAEIKGVYFNKASIKSSNLNRTVFTGCDFSGADLSDSLVNETDLSYTNLSRAKLKNMDLTSVNFEGADLTKANLRGSIINQQQLNSIFKKDGIKMTKSKIQ
jgi:uncharacterized protein YjbI with pentapeptide repeats